MAADASRRRCSRLKKPGSWGHDEDVVRRGRLRVSGAPGFTIPLVEDGNYK